MNLVTQQIDNISLISIGDQQNLTGSNLWRLNISNLSGHQALILMVVEKIQCNPDLPLPSINQ